MSLGDRLHQLAVRGCLIAGVLLLPAGIGPCEAQPIDQPNDSGTGAPGPAQEDGKPEGHADPSFPLAIQDHLDRIARALETANANAESQEERDRARKDVDAQVDMAFWAEWMFWSSTAQAVLTAAGLLLIGVTLVYTRRAANYAKDAAAAGFAAVVEAEHATVVARDNLRETKTAARRQLRPWIKLKVSLAGKINIEKGQNNTGLRIYSRIEIVNVGVSGAKNVNVHVDAGNAVDFDLAEYITSFSSECIQSARNDMVRGDLLPPTDVAGADHGTMVLDSDLTRVIDHGNGEQIVFPFVAVVITYRAIGDDEEIFYTVKVFHLVRSDGDEVWPIDLRRLPVAKNEARFVSVPEYAQAT